MHGLLVGQGKPKYDQNERLVDLRSAIEFLNDIGDMSEDAQDESPSPPAPVVATAPGESGWSARALAETFGKRMPGWLRKMGVRDQEVEDATQEVFVEILNELETIPADIESAQHELIRLTSRVACRRKRAHHLNERHVSDVETGDQINREEWIATRLLWAEALKVLDDASLKLFIAHDLEGHSYASIAAEMGEKEDTLEKRGAKVRTILRAEILRLLGKSNKRNRSSSGSMALVFGLSSFDRALFRTMFEMDEQVSIASPIPTIPKIRPSVSMGSMIGGLPLALLIGAILMLPGRSPFPSTLWAEKLGNTRLPDVVVSAALPSRLTSINGKLGTLPASDSKLPSKTQTIKTPPIPTIDKATKASLVRVDTPSLR